MANLPAFRTAAGWDTEKPPSNLGQSYVDDEKSLAGFVNLNYGVKSRFPIDGVAGVRVVKTKGTIDSSKYTVVDGQPVAPDKPVSAEGVGMQDDHHFNLDGHRTWVQRALATMKDKGWRPWAP